MTQLSALQPDDPARNPSAAPAARKIGAFTIARARTLAWVGLILLNPPPRLFELHQRRRLRVLEPILRRGALQVRGGMGARLWLAARHVEPWSAQAYGTLSGNHEPMVAEALRRTLPDGGAFFDIGANTGFTSMLAARIVGSRGTVVALDPQAECAAAVRAHAALNGFAHVRVVEAAAAQATGEAEIIVVEDSLWTRLATVGEHDLEQRRDVVRTVALDDLVSSGEAPAPDVVKIDVEGAELDVIAGMPDLLRAPRPVVICEMHGKNAAFAAAMRAHDYKVTNLDGVEPLEEAGANVHALCEPA
ncbi:MAG: FkbM family methyltransferase [Actinomycetota bacterium]|nr:FkbM family methyltransferase [Actinomycetota bacterium]